MIQSRPAQYNYTHVEIERIGIVLFLNFVGRHTSSSAPLSRIRGHSQYGRTFSEGGSIEDLSQTNQHPNVGSLETGPLRTIEEGEVRRVQLLNFVGSFIRSI